PFLLFFLSSSSTCLALALCCRSCRFMPTISSSRCSKDRRSCTASFWASSCLPFRQCSFCLRRFGDASPTGLGDALFWFWVCLVLWPFTRSLASLLNSGPAAGRHWGSPCSSFRAWGQGSQAPRSLRRRR